MGSLILCANSSCQRRTTCRRFNDDPVNLIHLEKSTRIEANLQGVDELECSRYLAMPVTLKLIKTKYASHH